MKTSHEMVEELFDRKKEYELKKARRTKKIIALSASACAVCAVIAAVMLIPGRETPLHGTTEPIEMTDKIFTGRIIYGNKPENEVHGIMWHGKQVSAELAEALKSAGPEDAVAISVSGWDNDFVYEGKTVGQYYTEYIETQDRRVLMEDLLHYGDALKYGEAVTVTGDDDGVIWGVPFYEECVARFGKLLDRYIADGEFLKEQLQQDIDDINEKQEAYKAFAAAHDAFLLHAAELLGGVKSGELADGGWLHTLVVYMTAEQFEKVELTCFGYHLYGAAEVE